MGKEKIKAITQSIMCNGLSFSVLASTKMLGLLLVLVLAYWYIHIKQWHLVPVELVIFPPLHCDHPPFTLEFAQTYSPVSLLCMSLVCGRESLLSWSFLLLQ